MMARLATTLLPSANSILDFTTGEPLRVSRHQTGHLCCSSMEARNSEDALRESLTGARADSDASSLAAPVVGKRKQPELNSTGRFKVVSQLVVAMNRFKGVHLRRCCRCSRAYRAALAQ